MDWDWIELEHHYYYYYHFFPLTKSLPHDGNIKSFNCFSPKLNLIDNSNFIFYACVNHLSFFFKFLLYFFVFASLYGSHYDEWNASKRATRTSSDEEKITQLCDVFVVVIVIVFSLLVSTSSLPASLLPANHIPKSKSNDVHHTYAKFSIISATEKGVLTAFISLGLIPATSISPLSLHIL